MELREREKLELLTNVSSVAQMRECKSETFGAVGSAVTKLRSCSFFK